MRTKTLWLVMAVLAVGVYGIPASAQWTPPIGIPHPGFGIDDVAPALPSPWTANTTGFYYVKQGGTNTGNGFPSSPRGSMPASVPAGSVVVLDHTAVFGSGTTVYTVSWAGTAAQPVFLQSAHATTKATWQAAGIEFTGSYVTIDRIDFYSPTDTSRAAFGGVDGSHHLTWRDCTVRGNLGGGGGGWGGGSSASPAHHHIWLRVTFRDNGNWQAAVDQDSHGYRAGPHLNNVWIVDSEFFHNSGDGVQLNATLGGATMASLHHIYIGRNTAYENKQNGFWTKQATDVIFSQNIAHDHRPSASSPGTGLGQQYGPERVWYIFNTVYNSDRGIHVASDNDGFGVDVYVIGNLFYDVCPTNLNYSTSDSFEVAAITMWDMDNRYIVGNTIWNSCAGIKMTPGTVTKAVVVNNIIGQPVKAGDRNIWIPVITNDAASEMNNNIVVGERISWDTDVLETLAQFQARTGKGANSLTTAPSLVNAALKNFRLASGDTQAKDKGVAHAVYDTYFSLYGVNIKKDLDGVARPQGSAWDIGAYELGVPGSIPAAPTGLRVN